MKAVFYLDANVFTVIILVFLFGQALVGCSIKIETLDGRKLSIAINDIVRYVRT